MNNKDLGQKIKKIRKEKGMTQLELTEKVGYSNRSMITKIEKGEIDLSESKIVSIAKALGVSPGYLVGWSDNQTQDTNTTQDIIATLTPEQKSELNMLLKQHNGLLMMSGIEPTENDKRELSRLITLSYLKSLGKIIK